MEISVLQGDITKVETEVLVIGIFKGITTPGGAAGSVDRALDGMLGALLSDGDFEGAEGETFLIRTGDRLPAKRILLLGLGERESFDLERARSVSAKAVQAAARFNELTTIVHGAGIGGLEAEDAAQALIEGAMLGKYSFQNYAQLTSSQIESLRIVESDVAKTEQLPPGRR